MFAGCLPDHRRSWAVSNVRRPERALVFRFGHRRSPALANHVAQGHHGPLLSHEYLFRDPAWRSPEMSQWSGRVALKA